MRGEGGGEVGPGLLGDVEDVHADVGAGGDEVERRQVVLVPDQEPFLALLGHLGEGEVRVR